MHFLNFWPLLSVVWPGPYDYSIRTKLANVQNFLGETLYSIITIQMLQKLLHQFYCSTTCLVWCIDCHFWQFFQSHNLDLYSEWTKKICSKRIKKSAFKFVKTSSNLVNSSDLNQDLVGDFQGIFTYQPSIFAAKFIVYSTIHLWFQSIAM